MTHSIDPTGFSYADALKAIWDRSNYDRGFISNPYAGDEIARLGLLRTARLLEALDRPQAAYPIVHIAGSKGKGSTGAFAASILTASGRRTGLTTSPHLHSFRERITVDGIEITAAEFAAVCARALSAAVTIEHSSPEIGRVTAFELVIAMALAHFAAVGCEVAVVEVGLGGLLDATNVVEPAVSVITTLDYEHTEILGSSMTEIAANKAGIIKPGVPVATAALPVEAAAVVAERAAENGSPWLMAGRDWVWRGEWDSFDLTGPWGRLPDLANGLLGDHQLDNASLAVAALWLAFGGRIDESAIRAGLRSTRWRGRFEIVNQGNRTLVLDGAHTPAAAHALTSAFQRRFPGKTATVVLGVLQGKHVEAIAIALAPIADAFVTAKPPGPRGLDAALLAESLRDLGRPVRSADSVERAIERIGSGYIIVTGSLATVAAAELALGLAKSDAPVAGAE